MSKWLFKLEKKYRAINKISGHSIQKNNNQDNCIHFFVIIIYKYKSIVKILYKNYLNKLQQPH